MTNGIVIHVVAGDEKRTEFFGGERVTLGTNADCDLRLEPAIELTDDERGVWLELRRENGFYQIEDFADSLDFEINRLPLRENVGLHDGDAIVIKNFDVSFAFFNVTNSAALTATTANAPARNAAGTPRFIAEAALESAASPRRDDAKVFLREFVRELIKEISWVTKLITLLIVIGALSGIFYLGISFYKEIQRTREEAAAHRNSIEELKNQIAKTTTEIGAIDESNKRVINILSLAPKLRNDYGNGICLIVGTYDLVHRQNGKQLRYPDPAAIVAPESDGQPSLSPKISENGVAPAAQIVDVQPPLITEGYGTPAEYDFVGTGFHVGNGYIVTNRHVVQPWAESEEVKVMAKLSNGRARLKKLVVYFPNLPNPIALRVRETSTSEDLAVAMIDGNSVFPEIPVLPLDTDLDATRVGTSVVSMGYPSGPDRILAMVDEKEARSLQSRCNASLQIMVNCLAQEKRITPLLTQGSITDLEAKRIVHDAKTAEGGSGAPLFGQSGRVIGVNFGVFTQNTAANMAVQISYAIKMLNRAGWKSPEQIAADAEKAKNENTNANVVSNVNSNTANKK